jgi:thioredoxin-like negative regulator of GroEL
MIAPVLDKLALEFSGKVRVAKVNVDENPMLSQQFRIQSIPMLMFVKNGKIVGQSPGVPPNAVAALRDVFNQLVNLNL